MLKIEKIKDRDVANVLEISAEQFGANGWQQELFFEELNKDNRFAFVARLDEEVVAFLFIMKTEGIKGTEFNILNIATKKEFQNMGIATEMFLFLKNFAKNCDVQNLWLEVRENNFNAIKFYKNLGFEVDYVRKNYYANGDNAFVMSMVLKEKE